MLLHCCSNYGIDANSTTSFCQRTATLCVLRMDKQSNGYKRKPLLGVKREKTQEIFNNVMWLKVRDKISAEAETVKVNLSEEAMKYSRREDDEQKQLLTRPSNFLVICTSTSDWLQIKCWPSLLWVY